MRASQRKWRQANPEYWKRYREEHPKSVARNRQQQQRRDRKRQVVNLARMNLALDLKREFLEVWFVGPVVKDLAKNNFAQSKVFIYQGIGPPAGG